MSHIIQKNPILKTNIEVKEKYLKLLRKYLRMGGWNKRKYVKAQINFYTEILLKTELSDDVPTHDLKYYRHYILFDLLHILGFDNQIMYSNKMKKIMGQYILDFPIMKNEKELIRQIYSAMKGNFKEWENLEKNYLLKEEKEYIKVIFKNLEFKKKKTSTFVVTANMSAGKSTFINALVGKYINLARNMACTSKIRSIISKTFEDGCFYVYDHELMLMADREELLNDNELNSAEKSIVSTYYNGILSGKRIIINDTPGVNFSGNDKHKEITERLIKSKKYDCLIYLMNATQLGTNDEEEHLEFVKKYIGRKTIIFIINKIDEFDVEEENVEQTIKKQIKYIKSKGFDNPIVCPVSSRAGYLVKINQYKKLARSETRELYSYIDKFEQMRLENYYNQYFPDIKIENVENEEIQLLKTCGFSYVETIIKTISEGGKINGTNLC